MPTPVHTAKQCLNHDASHALDEAVLVAKRRGHPQTTSLHAVSAFLSLSPSQLKEACVRARNEAFYPKVQLKALDFCLSVSLDRLPISQPRVDEPHVSNSLMAAIKRSQANQRRCPDAILAVKTNHNVNVHVGSCQDQNFGSNSSTNGVKVDLRHLIVAVLDDPIVSRVFNDAGFSSLDVKLSILRPFQSVIRYLGPGTRKFRFPFSGFWDEEGEYRRVVEVLSRKKGRNPLLVGVCANDVLMGFVEVLGKKREGILPRELCGVKVVDIEKDIVKFVSENWCDAAISLRFKEVGLMVDLGFGPGLIINVGDVKCFLSKDEGFEMDVVNCVVKKLSKLLEVHGGRIWVLCCGESDEVFMEFMNRFPLIDKDWDLQPLPITSVKASKGESCVKSSLMGSFVPFGGFFTSPPYLKGQFCSSSQSVTCCNISSGNSEQAITPSSKRGFVASADQYQTASSPWQQMADPGINSMLNDPKAKHGATLLPGTVGGQQRNWYDMCKSRRYNQPSEPSAYKSPTSAGFQFCEQEAKTVNYESSCITTSSCKDCDYAKINSCISLDSLKPLTSQSSKLVHLGSTKTDNCPAKLSESVKGTDHLRSGGSCSPYSLCVSGLDDGQTSPSSGVSVATDLGLDLFSQVRKQQKNAASDVNNGCHMTECLNSPSFDSVGHPADNCKALFKALFGKVGRQCEALRAVSQVVAQSWTSNRSSPRSGLRGDIWLNFIGSDLFCQWKTALALAEILFGSKKCFVSVDMSSEDVGFHQNKVFGYDITNGSDARSRGKTVMDHIVEKLRKTPLCVVFLENVHSADPVDQRCLLKAIRNSKFSDSCGREIALNNRIFIVTSKTVKDCSTSKFPEERLARAKCQPLQLVVKGAGDYTRHDHVGTGNNIPNQIFLSKRKLNGTHETVKRPHKGLSLSLDLNLPAETCDEDNTKRGDCNKFNCWSEEFSEQVVDNTLVKVFFDPFDYDSLATKLSKLVHASFCKATDSKCLLEIEPRAMDEIVAAACSTESDSEIKHWIEDVLSKGFAEAQKKYQLNAPSIVTLTTCETLHTEKQVVRVYLPSRISLS